MLAPFFHAWERRLAAVIEGSRRAPVRLGPRLDLVATVTIDALPEERVAAWVDGGHAATRQAFFDDAADVRLRLHRRASPTCRASGEAGTLRFPSALVTPHPENNTVVGRWFPAEGRVAASARARAAGRAVVVLPQWNSDARGSHRAGAAARALRRVGAAPQPALSRRAHAARADARRLHRQLEHRAHGAGVPAGGARCAARGGLARDQGFERIGILGTSLGSCLAMLTSAHEPLIRAQALNHVSPWFADVVWRGLSTRHVRAGTRTATSISSGCARLWRPISPF